MRSIQILNVALNRGARYGEYDNSRCLIEFDEDSFGFVCY